MTMNRLKRAMMIGAFAALLCVATACTFESEAATLDQDAEELQPVYGPEPAVGTSYGAAAATAGSANLMQTPASQEPVIWVAGSGSVAVEPDLAMLDLSVEVTLPTVAEGRDEASRTVNAVMAALTAAGVEDRDVQTRRFDISPRYEYREVETNGVRSGQEVLVGYRVSNRLSVKVRNMDTVGQVIDDVIEAGGDAIRFRNLQFTVEDTSPLMEQLREDAVTDAKTKAQHYAHLAGLVLGDVVYMAEPNVSAIGFGRESFGVAAAALQSGAFYDTGISGGELQVSLGINMAFAAE